MADIVQIRRDTAANWTSANPTLANGEQGYETDTAKMKIGDGVTAWNSLAYFAGSGGSSTWLGLSDTPGAFNALQLVRANATPNALEFVNPNTLDVGKVDGCDAGVATTNVFKIPGSLARGDIFYINASGNLVRLPAGDTGKFLKTQGATGDPVWEALPGGGDMLQATYDPNGDGIFAMAQGGTGQTSAQTAIDALTQVSAATTAHVLTKDVSGHATWAAGGGGGVTAHSALTELDYASAGHTGFAGNPAVANQDMAGKMIIGVGNIFAQYDSSFCTVNGGMFGSHGSRIYLCGEDYSGANGNIYLAVPNAAKNDWLTGLMISGATDTPKVGISFGLDMNSKKIENLLIGSAAADAVRYDQVVLIPSGSAQGDILYRDAAGWTRLAYGTNGHFLKTQGAGANPVWAAGGGSTTWVGLTDTLGVITANQLVVGNASGTSLQFIAPSALNVDKVDSCDAGIAAGNVFKIPASIAQGDVFFVNASGNIVRLAAGTNGHFLKTQGAAADAVWAAVPGGGDMLKSTYDSNADGIFAMAQGGTGQTTAQAATDAITQVSGATNEHVLTKDTGTGNAAWKAAPGAASGGDAAYVLAANDTPATLKSRADVACNAVSDETDINTAFATYDTVKLTEGTFIIDGSISQGDNKALIGSGPGTIIKLKDSFNSGINMFVNADTVGGNTGLLISNLTIDGNRAGQTTGYMYGIVWDTVTEGAIRDCWIKGLRTDSIRFVADCKYCQILDNIFVDSKWGPCVEGGSEYCQVEGNTIWKMLMDGIYIEKASHNSIKNNVIVASGQFTDNSYAGIFLSGAVGEEANYNDIQGNTIRDGAETNNPQYAIKVNSAYCNHTLIANNDCYDCAQTGTFSDSGTNTNWGAGNRKNAGTWATGV